MKTLDLWKDHNYFEFRFGHCNRIITVHEHTVISSLVTTVEILLFTKVISINLYISIFVSFSLSLSILQYFIRPWIRIKPEKTLSKNCLPTFTNFLHWFSVDYTFNIIIGTINSYIVFGCWKFCLFTTCFRWELAGSLCTLQFYHHFLIAWWFSLVLL